MLKRELNFLVILAMIVAMLAACEKVSDTDKDSDEQNLFRRNAEKNFYNFK